MNIVLIGPRGSGKTDVGQAIARKLNRKLIWTDGLIIKKAGMTIAEIVKKYGWDKFRDIESEVAEEVGSRDNYIIDTGGGIILREKNVDSLKKNGVIILLMADVKTLVNRIKDDAWSAPGRPSLTGKKSFTEEMEEVLKERKEKYEKAADYIIDTSKLNVKQVADKAIEYLRKNNKL